LAFQTIYSYLNDPHSLEERKYSLGEIIEACKQMEAGHAAEIRHGMFVHPTRLGEDIITALTGLKPNMEPVAPFSPPPPG
jgi:hypothetical protein